MKHFQTTPQKKFIGMLILFVFIPLFLLWYVIFFLDKKPDETTIAIIACIALLALYLYWKYKKQIDALGAGKAAEPVAAEESPEEAELPEENLEDLAESETEEENQK